MNVTESRFKNRQLHIEDYLQMVSAEQKENAEVFGYSKITEKSGAITDYWMNNLWELILRKETILTMPISKPKETEAKGNRWYAGECMIICKSRKNLEEYHSVH